MFLSARSQSPKAADWRIPTRGRSGKGKTGETIRRAVVEGAGGEAEMMRGPITGEFRAVKYRVCYQNNGTRSSKLTEQSPLRVNPKVNSGLQWMGMKCDYFIFMPKGWGRLFFLTLCKMATEPSFVLTEKVSQARRGRALR